MGINPVSQGIAASQTATTSPKSATRPIVAASQTSSSSKDTAVVSQKAKDLAAAKAGKAFAEESQESMSAKEQEAAGE